MARRIDPGSGHALRVAVVTETYPPEINGVANTVAHIVRGLAARGHQVTLLRPAQERGDGVVRREGNIIEIPTAGVPLPFYPGLQLGLPAGRIISRAFRKSEPDVVYAATEGPLGVSAQQIARRLKVPVVSGFHTNFQAYSRHYGFSLLGPAILRYLRRFHNRCDQTLVPTRELAVELESRDFRNVAVWARGVDTSLFNPTRRDTALRRSWGVAEGGVAVLYVGRLAPEKNIKLAVRAFEAVHRRRPDARFVLVGDGPEMAHLQGRYPELVFAGPRTGEALATHYASADLFLFPSCTETFGNVVTEAMASGLPVVSFRLAAAREYLEQGITGVVVEAGDEAGFIDAAAETAVNDSLRRDVGMRARLAAARLDWDGVIAALELILFRTIEQAAKGGSRGNVVAASE